MLHAHAFSLFFCWYKLGDPTENFTSRGWNCSKCLNQSLPGDPKRKLPVLALKVLLSGAARGDRADESSASCAGGVGSPVLLILLITVRSGWLSSLYRWAEEPRQMTQGCVESSASQRQAVEIQTFLVPSRAFPLPGHHVTISSLSSSCGCSVVTRLRWALWGSFQTQREAVGTNQWANDSCSHSVTLSPGMQLRTSYSPQLPPFPWKWLIMVAWILTVFPRHAKPSHEF